MYTLMFNIFASFQSRRRIEEGCRVNLRQMDDLKHGKARMQNRSILPSDAQLDWKEQRERELPKRLWPVDGIRHGRRRHDQVCHRCK